MALSNQYRVEPLKDTFERYSTPQQMTYLRRLNATFCGICGDMLDAGGYTTQQRYIDAASAMILPPEEKYGCETVVLLLPKGLEGAEDKIAVTLASNYFSAAMTPIAAGVLLTLLALSSHAIRSYEEGNEREHELAALQYHHLEGFARTLPDYSMIKRAMD